MAPARSILLAGLLALAGCRSFDPVVEDPPPFADRVQAQAAEGVTVSCAVPTRAEAEALYGVDLARFGIQPIWLEVDNRDADDRFWWLLPAGMDPHHYSPTEAAYAFHADASSLAEEIEGHFRELHFANPVPPGSKVSGYLLVNLDEGYKAVDVDLMSREASRSFTFVFVDPDFRADFTRVDLDAIWAPEELVHLDTEDELRAAIADLPTCTNDRSGESEGDPLNLVMVGERREVFAAMVRRGWHATELITRGSLWRTVKSFLSGSRYRYSPISPLYVYGRPQDFSAQKARGSINERNHMRFWQTPLRFRGREVWVGQISRDIGVKFTLKSPTISTHVIDPDVDEARRYLLEDLAYSQTVVSVGFVRAQERVTREAPRFNLVGDPYFTDGHRVVMFFERRPVALDAMRFLPWDDPGKVRILTEEAAP